ncbi:MAG: S8 family serine peptidase, partial [Candidatus Thermoplasmatota archaeon]
MQIDSIANDKKIIDDSDISCRFFDKDRMIYTPGDLLIKFSDSVDVLSPDNIRIVIDRMQKDDPSLTSVLCIKPVFRSNPQKQNEKTDLSKWFKITVASDVDIEAEIQRYKQSSLVEEAQPNYIMRVMLEPNDPYYHKIGSWGQGYNDLYGLHMINVKDAWDVTIGSKDVIVAVVDTGIDYTHPDIINNLWINDDEIPDNNIDDDQDGFIDNIYGADFAYDDGDPKDGHGHGTHCAGIIGAVGNNNLGVVGVNWHCSIMAVKGMDDSGSGPVEILADAIRWAADQGARVLSNSWGPSLPISPLPVVEDAIKYAYNLGCVIVFAAGNNDDDASFYSPANMKETIAVAALDPYGQRAWFSNWGSAVDVCAPGVDVLSLRANGTDMYGDETHIVDEEYYRSNGTSMACPHVAGLAALVLSINSSLTPAQLKDLLVSTGDDVSSTEPIGKRINVSDAVYRRKRLISCFDIRDWANVKGNYAIKGTAWGENFRYYRIEIGYGRYPQLEGWVEVINSTESVINNTLAVLDTNGLREGTYHLRLQVVCEKDHIIKKTTQMMIVINNEDNIYMVGDGKGGYPTVQSAVDDAGFNDTIIIKKGVYIENILVDRPVNIKGEDILGTTMQGQDRGYVVTITGDYVCFSDMSIKPHVDSYNAIALLSNNTIVTNLVVSSFGRCIIKEAHHNVFSNVVLQSNHCLKIKGSRYNTIANCSIAGGRYSAVYIWTSQYNTVTDCTVRGYWMAVDLQGHASYNTITRNFFLDNTEWGVSMIYYCNNNTFTNNIFEGNKGGVYLEGVANNNTFVGNLIASCSTSPGVKTDLLPFFGGKPLDNILYHNSFIANVQNAYDIYRNKWYHAMLGRGNYWSDYNGSDLNGDGIGDTPYLIPPYGKNKDMYPLMRSGFFACTNGPFFAADHEWFTCRGKVYGGTPPYTWHWDFGDGNTSTEQNVTFMYAKPGRYVVTFKVTDAMNNISVHKTTATIQEPRVFNIDENKGYWLIQSAINDAVANQTILVTSDIYFENVVIDKPLSLYGEGERTTYVDPGSVGNVITIKADNVTISGFTLRRSGWNSAALKIEGDHCVITNNTFTSSYFGIRSNPSSCLVIERNA